jgi:hypothetical protein
MDTFEFDALSYSSDTLIQITFEIFVKVRTPTECLHATMLSLSFPALLPPDDPYPVHASSCPYKIKIIFPSSDADAPVILGPWVPLPFSCAPLRNKLTSAPAQFDFLNKLKISAVKLKKFILCVRSCMFDNPYHNWFHAFDVTQVNSQIPKLAVLQRGSQPCKTISSRFIPAPLSDFIFPIGLPLSLFPSFPKTRIFLLATPLDCLVSVLPTLRSFSISDTQTTYCLAIQAGLDKSLTSVELFALIISALCHDLEHPGVNNPFLIASCSDLATLYNDRSVLENHHCCRAFQLILHKEIQLLSEFSKQEYFIFRGVVLANILATDMARHGEYTTKLKRAVDPTTLMEDGLIDKQFLMEIIMKCADTSNVGAPCLSCIDCLSPYASASPSPSPQHLSSHPSLSLFPTPTHCPRLQVLKPFPIAKKWAMRVTDEFFLQGDQEKAKNLPLTPMCDRGTQGRVALQKGFIDFVIGVS